MSAPIAPTHTEGQAPRKFSRERRLARVEGPYPRAPCDRQWCVVVGPRSFHIAHGAFWPAPGSEDTELGVMMELEVGHGEAEIYAGVQA
jgi:hypothetical protein